MKCTIPAALGAVLLFSSVGASQSQKYVFRTFDPIGSVDTEPYGINNHGLISGQWFDALGNGYGFVLDGNQFTSLVPPGGSSVTGGGPTVRGQVPLSFVGADNLFHSSVWQSGVFTYLPDLTTYPYWGPNALNEAGHEAGIATNDPTFSDTSAFYYAHGVYTVFKQPGSGYFLATGINDEDEMVGAYEDSTGQRHGWLQNGPDQTTFTVIDPPGSIRTFSYGINDSHVIAGSFRRMEGGSPGPRHGFLWRAGKVLTYLDYPGALNTWATFVNEKGVVVGFYEGTDGNIHGFAANPL